MKYSPLLILLIITGFSCFSQTSITSFPENLQLFVREPNNTCNVKIEGNVDDVNVQRIELKLFRNDTLVFSGNEPRSNFKYTIPLQAELSEYSFVLNKIVNNNTIKIVSADKVLCGDVILLSGQSNMSALAGINEFNAIKSDKFMRNFSTANGDTTAYNWFTAKYPYGSVGTIGNYLMLNLIDSLKIPFLTINSSIGGAQIWQLSARNESNHFDQHYEYGKMLTKLKAAKILNKVKFIAFLQGEAAAGNWHLDCNEYPGHFNKYITQIQEDIPSIKKFYEFQINILENNNGHIERAGFLRDFQRKTSELYPEYVEVLSTVGNVPYDGIHYGSEAYIEKAKNLSKHILRDVYARTTNKLIDFPNIQYAYYTPNKDSVVLEFQKNQSMLYPASLNYGNYTREMKHYIYFTNDNQTIYFNQYNTGVSSGSGELNKIKLKLTALQNYAYITYLPATFTDSYSNQYNGPHFSNTSGLRSFSFYCFPISNAPRIHNPNPTLPESFEVHSVSKNRINAVWKDISTNQDTFMLEISSDSLSFTPVFSGLDEFSAIGSLEANKKYFFRIKSCNTTGCTSYSTIKNSITYKKIDYNCLDQIFRVPISSLNTTYRTSTTIVSSAIENSNVVFSAAKSIEFRTGFIADAAMSTVFVAKIQDCANP